MTKMLISQLGPNKADNKLK